MYRIEKKELLKTPAGFLKPEINRAARCFAEASQTNQMIFSLGSLGFPREGLPVRKQGTDEGRDKR